MKSLFSFLAVIANIALLITVWLGWRIDNAAALDELGRHQVSLHFLFALGSASFALFVHAVCLTYFMGTGRWIQETSEAYAFDSEARAANMRLKYRALPGMLICLALILVTAAFGAIADPASNTEMAGSKTIHLILAWITVVANLTANLVQYRAICRNTRVVDAVYQAVIVARRERGLEPAEPTPAS